MVDYDYSNDVNAAVRLLDDLEGALVARILVNVVIPEFNVVYLITDRGCFALQGEIGGEYLGIHKLDDEPIEVKEDGYIISSYQPFSQFERRRIVAARTFGEVWNGHGFELSFEGIVDKTMLVQSIYSGEKPTELEDCLRLGIGHYALTMPET